MKVVQRAIVVTKDVAGLLLLFLLFFFSCFHSLQGLLLFFFLFFSLCVLTFFFVFDNGKRISRKVFLGKEIGCRECEERWWK
jgi:hypothetical protein